MPNKPHSPSCDRNQQPILSVIQPLLQKATEVLEVGSGTGQHAVYFGQAMPYLQWQTSDQIDYHPAIQLWLDESGRANVLPPLSLNVLTDDWPNKKFDAVFSANTAHIMSWQAVQCFVAGVANVLKPDGIFILYGPFNYGGQFSSDSNRQFEQWLIDRDPLSGIRDFEALDELAENNEMNFENKIAMPANNEILVWRKNKPSSFTG